MNGYDFGWKISSMRERRNHNRNTEMSSSNAKNDNHNRLTIFEEDDEEDVEISEAQVSTSVVSDPINNKRKIKGKVRHGEEDEEKKKVIGKITRVTMKKMIKKN